MEKNNGVFEYGLASKNEREIISFLDKIYSIPIEESSKWEKLIMDFFSENLIVPYVIQTYLEESLYDSLLNSVKEIFLQNIINPKTVLINTNTIFKELIKIRSSLKTGVKLKEYLPYLFYLNFTFRRICIKRTDFEDKGFHNFKVGIRPFNFEIKYEGQKIPVYETTFFILPDSSVDYPLEKWHKEISTNWKEKMKNLGKPNNKKNGEQKRSPIDSRLRHECFKRDGYKCKECGNTNKESILHADHILPVSQGGSDELENLQTLCEECNLAKSNKCWGENGTERKRCI